MNDLDEESEKAREEVDGDAYNNTTDKIEVLDDDEEKENEHIKMYEEDYNNSLHEYEENKDEDEDRDEIYYVNIAFIFILFEDHIENNTFFMRAIVNQMIEQSY